MKNETDGTTHAAVDTPPLVQPCAAHAELACPKRYTNEDVHRLNTEVNTVWNRAWLCVMFSEENVWTTSTKKWFRYIVSRTRSHTRSPTLVPV